MFSETQPALLSHPVALDSPPVADAGVSLPHTPASPFSTLRRRRAHILSLHSTAPFHAFSLPSHAAARAQMCGQGQMSDFSCAGDGFVGGDDGRAAGVRRCSLGGVGRKWVRRGGEESVDSRRIRDSVGATYQNFHRCPPWRPAARQWVIEMVRRIEDRPWRSRSSLRRARPSTGARTMRARPSTGATSSSYDHRREIFDSGNDGLPRARTATSRPSQ